ncbi:mucin-5AC-like [Pectinophora gossypiella]|uniref:mucin-5AC-like n=1 Tax=Pectinophora gossypiella TaxID=13191 RepID=UPI00214E1FB2|nr:mucin-5AC-like [Pectinophora gossypiella]
MRNSPPNFLPQTTKRAFLRRTKATALPDTDTTAPTEEVTSPTKPPRRGYNTFKIRKDTKSTTEVDGEKSGKTDRRRPSLNGGARSERPTRNFVRRRPSGANGTTSSSSTSSPSSTPSPSPAVSRRPFRVAARRRPLSTTTSTTITSTTTTSTTETPTTELISEEYLQDISEEEIIEEPIIPQERTANHTKTRRPLLLKDETVDQNPSATNEEERKRHSKKYSSSFKQNQLDEVLKQRAKLSSQEEDIATTEANSKTTFDDAETALAIAAHALLSAPIPSISSYDDEPKPTKRTKPPTTTFEYTYTNPTYTEEYTDTKTAFDGVSSTPIYKTTVGNKDFVQTTSGTVYDITTGFNSPRTPSTFTPRTSTFASTPFTAKVSRPAAFTTSSLLTTVAQDPTEYSRLPPSTLNPGFSRTRQNSATSGFSRGSVTTGPSSLGPSTARYVGTSDKLIPVPVEDYSLTTGGYSSIGQEPSYFTREYLLESPVTKTYDDEYQYLSPTTPQSTTRKIPKKIAYRKISTTIRPTVQTYVPEVTPPAPRRVPSKKPFEKIPKGPAKFKPVENYDYYDDGAENIAQKYQEGTKVVLHSKGNIECLDIGNFPHPTSCKKFISCARLENGSLLGWEYICPKGLSFDPVGGICNWSAGLGCHEKDEV